MSRPEGRRGWGARTLRLVLAAALASGVVAGSTIWRPEVERLLGLDDEPGAGGAPGSSASVSATPDPGPPLLPPPAVPAVIAREVMPAESGAVDPVRVREAIAPVLRDRALGGHVVVRVADLAGGRPVLRAGTAPMVPASTTKLLTTMAALASLGPDRVFSTKVVQGRRPGQLVLVGGGDPLLRSTPQAQSADGAADLATLAEATAAALRGQGRTRVRLTYDDSLFSGPTSSPTWEPDYLPDQVVAPITALWVDEGRPRVGSGRVPDPSAYAARVFAHALAKRGIRVIGAPVAGRAPGSAPLLAQVDSPPLDQIVEQVLEVSDNEAAEVLAHQVGLAETGQGSFQGGAQGVLAVLEELGVPLSGAEVYDGSGLSRADRLDPRSLVEVLRLAADPERPELRPVLLGLPVAGFTGSLAYRFEEGDPHGRGSVRAKTGTLTGVSGLAGLVTDLDGNTMVFVAVADRVRLEDTLEARAALDRLASGLAGCHCSAVPGG